MLYDYRMYPKNIIQPATYLIVNNSLSEKEEALFVECLY